MTTQLIHYKGKVQGVGFRVMTLRLARGYEVAGYVKNLPTGEVELLIRGNEEEVALFLEAIREGELRGHIEEEKNLSLPPEVSNELFKGFMIR